MSLITISNGKIDFTLSEHKTYGLVPYRIEIDEAIHPNGFYFVSRDLWGINNVVYDYECPIQPSNTSCRRFSWSMPSDSKIVAQWDQVRHPYTNEQYDVTVDIEAPANDRVVEFRISITGYKSNLLPIRNIIFPIFAVDFGNNAAFPSEQTVLAYPYVCGALFTNPVLCADLIEGENIFGEDIHHSMQFYAVYNEKLDIDGMLYWGTRDLTGHLKQTIITSRRREARGSNGLNIGLRHIPANNKTVFRGKYKAAYPFVLSVIKGDWYDAAKYYRSWAIKQPWAQVRGPLRKTLPNSPTHTHDVDLIKEADMVAHIFGLDVFDEEVLRTHGYHPPRTVKVPVYRNWLKEIREQKQMLDVNAIVCCPCYHWYPPDMDTELGRWFPIGRLFQQQGKQIHQSGFASHGPYFNNMKYAKNIKSFSYPNIYVPGYNIPPSHGGGDSGGDLSEYGILKADGTRSEGQDKYANPTMGVCLATKFARDYTIYVAKQLEKYAGASGIYLDVFCLANPTECYDKNHQHNAGNDVGGGDIYLQGKVRLIRELKAEMRKSTPGFFVASEGPQEMYLGELDLAFGHCSLDTKLWAKGSTAAWRRIVPLWQTVYHEYLRLGPKQAHGARTNARRPNRTVFAPRS